jgi:HSP20 family protein
MENRCRMDLHEDAEKNLVTATFELPGLTKDKVNIDMHAGNLIISGEVSESTEKTEHGYAVRERRTGRFSRSVGLPEGTKVSAVACIHTFNEDRELMGIV